MELEELSGSQMFLAGSIMTKLSEEMKKEYRNNNEEDAKKAMKYILSKFDEINKEITEEVLKQTIEGMNRLREVILDD